MTTQEDVAVTIKQGMIAHTKLDQALRELEDLKKRYADCMSKYVQDERDMAEAKLEEAQANLQEKDNQLELQEKSIKGAKHINSRMFNAGHPTTNVSNIFVHEYNQLMLLKAPHHMWLTVKNSASWLTF